MNTRKQSKNFKPRPIGAAAVQAALAAIEECRAKPPYDYQRVILCLGESPGLVPRLARHPGATLIDPSQSLSFSGPPATVIVQGVGERGPSALESIVCFINQTRGVVLILATAQEVARWQDSWPVVAAQLRRHTHIVIDFSLRAYCW
jgi:hypothetical protein